MAFGSLVTIDILTNDFCMKDLNNAANLSPEIFPYAKIK